MGFRVLHCPECYRLALSPRSRTTTRDSCDRLLGDLSGRMIKLYAIGWSDAIAASITGRVRPSVGSRLSGRGSSTAWHRSPLAPGTEQPGDQIATIVGPPCVAGTVALVRSMSLESPSTFQRSHRRRDVVRLSSVGHGSGATVGVLQEGLTRQ